MYVYIVCKKIARKRNLGGGKNYLKMITEGFAKKSIYNYYFFVKKKKEIIVNKL